MIKYILISLLPMICLFPQGYFPLEIGNKWNYSRAENGVPKTDTQREILGDSIMPNGFKYSVIRYIDPQLNPSYSFYRQEGNKVLSYYLSNLEMVDCDFSKRLGDTIFYQDSPKMVKTVIEYQSTNILGRVLQHWSVKTFYPDFPMPFYLVETFTDSLGITRVDNHNELVTSEICSEAIINGITYGGNVPVELISFMGRIEGNLIKLKWDTATELNNQGFEVERKSGGNDFVKMDFIRGHGTTTSPNQYTFTDGILDPGKYTYRLKQMDFGGRYKYSTTIEFNLTSFITYKLEQNYPNPFNPVTRIAYSLPVDGLVILKVFDILGKEVTTLINENKKAGRYEVMFDGSRLASGVYYYRIIAGNYEQTNKMVLLK